MAHGPAISTGGRPLPTSRSPTRTTVSCGCRARDIRYWRRSCFSESCMLAWNTCLKSDLTVASSKGPRFAATSASSISCSRTGSYCDMPAAVCRAPISAATLARSERSSRMRRFSSSIRARRLRMLSGIPDSTLAEPDHEDGDLEEDDERHRHQGEVERVAGGCDHDGEGRAADDGPAAARDEALACDHAHAGEQEPEHRHLEHEAEHAHEHEDRRDVAADRQEPDGLAPQEPEQEGEGEGQYDEVGERRAQGEREGREEDEGHGVAALLGVEAGRHERPHLTDHDGGGED